MAHAATLIEMEEKKARYDRVRAFLMASRRNLGSAAALERFILSLHDNRPQVNLSECVCFLDEGNLRFAAEAIFDFHSGYGRQLLDKLARDLIETDDQAWRELVP